MNQITADPALQATLCRLNEPTEIRDANGEVIGYFTPVDHEEAILYQRAAVHFDPDEMKRRKESGATGLTTAEVLTHLQSLEIPE